jgi:hypothetical protein
MIGFIRAHGSDPGPTERPLLAGAVVGLLATLPAGLAFVGFGSFAVAADQVVRAPRPVTAALLLALFTAGGLVYGGVFRRAANDRRAGWMLGLAYGFLMWIAAPIVVLPLLRSDAMAAGTAADGFLVAFLLWGLTVGIAFPFVHRPLHAGLDGRSKRFGPDVVTLRQKLLRRPTAG